MENKIVNCLIPVRSGSKRIKNKNIKKINGLPLVKYVCANIIKSKKVDRFYLATDKLDIYNKLDNLKKKIFFFKRSKKSASDYAQTEIVIEEFINKENIKGIIVLVQVTNPFINFKHIDEAINLLTKKKLDCVFSAVKSKHFIWSNSKKIFPLNYNYKKRNFSQSIKGHYVENGSFYIFNASNFLKLKNRLHGKIGVYEMPIESIHEIDDKEDFNLISKLLK